MAEVESRAFKSFTRTTPSCCYSLWTTSEMKLTHMRWRLSGNTSIQRMETTSSLMRISVEIPWPFYTVQYWLTRTEELTLKCKENPEHTDKHLLFDHQITQARGHQNPTAPSTDCTHRTEGKEKEGKHIKQTLRTCAHPNWPFVKST